MQADPHHILVTQLLGMSIALAISIVAGERCDLVAAAMIEDPAVRATRRLAWLMLAGVALTVLVAGVSMHWLLIWWLTY
jgi:hypothetical protein